MAAYQHSESFASLKNIKEDVDQNLTTSQWLQTLDYFLESSLDPIATAYADLMDNYFAVVVAWQAHKPSIKFSRTDKFLLPVKLFNSLTAVRLEDKRANQKAMLLNRGLLFGLATLFHRTLNSYKRLHSHKLRISRAKRMFLLNKAETELGSRYIFPAIKQSAFFLAKAHHFKELIIQKYTRLAIMSAKRTYTELNCEVSLDDAVQIYLIYLARAIDRCDSRQGVLTTFIQTWFYSAKTEVKNSIDTQHSSYDDLLESGVPVTTVDPDLGFEAVQHLAYEAKRLDPSGVVRFSLGIPEFYSRSQIATLNMFALN
jgi:hypothetical protein